MTQIDREKLRSDLLKLLSREEQIENCKLEEFSREKLWKDAAGLQPAVVFDLDGVVVPLKFEGLSDFEPTEIKEIPNSEIIQLINDLQTNGVRIIIYTSRLEFTSLSKKPIPKASLIGELASIGIHLLSPDDLRSKPFASAYIDDLSINPTCLSIEHLRASIQNYVTNLERSSISHLIKEDLKLERRKNEL